MTITRWASGPALRTGVPPDFVTETGEKQDRAIKNVSQSGPWLPSARRRAESMHACVRHRIDASDNAHPTPLRRRAITPATSTSPAAPAARSPCKLTLAGAVVEVDVFSRCVQVTALKPVN